MRLPPAERGYYITIRLFAPPREARSGKKFELMGFSENDANRVRSLRGADGKAAGNR